MIKKGTFLTDKYFEEQLERVREIRASERKFYATVQNKMHYAIHGHTAAEHILERADHQKQNMGLMTWQDAPDGKIKKSDVIIAKNYLSEFELSQLNRMVTSYLDFAVGI